LFAKYQFSAVMHFASLIDVAESVKFPGKYYQNNVAATLNLLESMHKNKVNHFIFSSSAAVYGEPQYTPIDESHPIAPINPYGRSKWMVEEIIKDYAQSTGLHYTILRYFNAAGAHPEGCLGEAHDPESHLIPLILNAALQAQKSITVYGRDYPTADGTCVRDYVHVLDLCNAHLLALQTLLDRKINTIYNLGTGQGYSVQQVIDMVSQVTKRPIRAIDGPRRSGDSAILIADASLAKRELAWQPKYADLDIIIKHAWAFVRDRAGAAH
jgi:UDP-glucose 4-epimerase